MRCNLSWTIKNNEKTQIIIDMYDVHESYYLFLIK